MNEVIVIIILILVNGIFSMSEIAVISARKSSLSTDVKKGSNAADTALKLANQPEKFLSTVQIGITLIGILTGIYSGAKLADSFTEILVDWNVPKTYAPAISQTTIVIVVTYLTILFGELVPKRLGLSSAERIAKIIARPMQLLSIIAAPFVWILSHSTSFIFNMRRTSAVLFDRSQTKGEDIKERKFIGFATNIEARSAHAIPIRFGTNSPKINVRYVTIMTMADFAIPIA